MPIAARHAFRFTARLLAGSTAVGTGTIAYHTNTDEGFRRSFYFWRKAFPIYLHYRVTQLYMENLGWKEEDQDLEYEKLHNYYAPKVFNIVLVLKGFYVKLAQTGSTRSDFLPKQYLDRAASLQDDAPAKDISEIIHIIELSYGKKFHELFHSIDETPLGAASIGQCHRATLATNHHEVAVKVQHPDAEEFFRWDIKTVKDFCRLFQPAHLPYLEEVEKQFMTEFDYRLEAKNLATCRENILNSPYAKKVVLPEPYMDLCTKEVLVMEFLKGRKLIDGIRDHFEAIAASRDVTVEYLKAEQQKKDDARAAQGLDIESGPSENEMRWYVWSFAIQKMLRKSSQTIYNYTLGLIYPIEWTTPAQYTHNLLNIPEILKLIMDVHGYEIFIDGAFNGDPHPGNIMLLDDGRLGLIDYGQVKFISLERRKQLARLILALAEGTKEDVVHVMTQEMGIKTKNMNEYFLDKQAHLMIDNDDRQVTEGKNVQLFVEYLDTIDQITYLPDDFVMAFRASLLLRGFSYALHYKFSHAQSWKSFAKQILKEPDIHEHRLEQK